MDSSNPSQLRSEVLRVAESWLGLEFKSGQREQCASFVRAVFAEAGQALPVARAPSDFGLTGHLPQGPAFANSLSSDEVGRQVELEAAAPGDLLLFRDTYEGDFPGGSITHVGIYAGSMAMIDRSTAAGPVRRLELDPWWISRLREVRSPHLYRQADSRERVADLCRGHWVQRSLALAGDLSIADILEEEPLTLVELADRRSLNPPALERLMRGLCALGVFALDGDGRYRNSGLSAWLLAAREGSLRNYLLARARPAEWNAWMALSSCLGSGAADRSPVGGPSRAWAGAVCDALLAEFGLAEVDCLVDLGRHEQGMVFEALARSARLKAVVKAPQSDAESDRQAVLARGLEERLAVWPGDLLEDLLPVGDVYLLPLVLSSLDDADAVVLLGRLCQSSGRVILVEPLADESPFGDLQRLVLGLPDRERTRWELETICGQSGWNLGQVLSTPTPLWLMELTRGSTQENETSGPNF